MPSLRIVFAGSPFAAIPSLERLLASDHEVVAVITRNDSPHGRKRVLTPTPVATVAESRGVDVIRANRLDDAVTAQVSALEPDLGVIVAYGGLVREPLLSTPRLGWINLHFSLLPHWRGAAPVQRALIAGDDITGTTVFQLVPELDAGDWFGQSTQAIGGLQTAGHLLESLAVSGADLLARVVDALADGTARAEPQVGDVSLAPKLTLDDGLLDLTRSADDVHNRFRGVTPEPGAFTTVGGERLKIIDATIARNAARLPPGRLALIDKTVLVGTGTHPLVLHRVHPAGRSAMSATDWWRGRPAGASENAQ